MEVIKIQTTVTFLSISEAAQLLDVKYWQIDYAVRAGYIPPPIRIAGKKVYELESLPVLRNYFAHK